MAYLINAYLSTRFEKIVDVTPASRHRQLGLRSEIRSLYTCLIYTRERGIIDSIRLESKNAYHSWRRNVDTGNRSGSYVVCQVTKYNTVR